MKKLPFAMAFFLTACVTINIYFPAAAAEKVADEIIQEIQKDKAGAKQIEPQSALPPWQKALYSHIDQVLNFLISPAQAAANLSVDTAEIRRIRASMKSRFRALKGFYQQGFVGIQRDGLLTLRGNVPLQHRNKVKKLVAAENADRNKLYQAIANANGHPEWYQQIKNTFAARWVSNAQSGWRYQNSQGRWTQK